ncbi:MAG: biotin/lipoyl-binding protein [Anaerolineae bacterium]|nr:biotin/lipoyl-binding protein [Anaerolineae bacterium]
MKKRWWILGVVLVAVGGYLSYARWLKPGNAGAQATEKVTELVVVARGALQNSIEGSGNLVAAQERALAFGSGGRVTAIYIVEGEHVTAGQPLVQLETTSLELSVKQAEASLAKAQVQLAATLSGATEAEIAAAEAAVSSAQASYAQVKEGVSTERLTQLQAELDLAAQEVQQAQGNYDRYGDRMAASLQDATLAYERAQFTYDIAAEVDSYTLTSVWSNVEQRQADLDALLAGSTEEERATAELGVQQVEISLQKAQR